MSANQIIPDKRKHKEMLTISRMIHIYCAGNHPADKSNDSYCGKPLCSQCSELDTYAIKRTSRCPAAEKKTTCQNCTIHCYAPEKRAAIKEIMRYAGPRMLTRYPIDALRHLFSK